MSMYDERVLTPGGLLLLGSDEAWTGHVIALGSDFSETEVDGGFTSSLELGVMASCL